MKYQHRVLGMLSLLSIITDIDRVCIAVAGPRIQESLHITPEQWGWVTSVFFLSYMNTAANLASSVAAVAFGYLVAYTGSYTAPFIPMLALLCLGAVLWLKLDPSHDIFEEEESTALRAAVAEPAV